MAGVRRMIRAARTDRQRALVALCGFCGLRIGEALEVRPSDFSLGEMELTVRGKGDKLRIVPISEEAWKYMQEAVTRAFVSGNDDLVVGFKDRFARSVVTRLAKRANLTRHVASHDLRATFLTAAYDLTLDLRLVQDLAGHAHSTTTEIYTEVTKKKLHDTVNKL